MLRFESTLKPPKIDLTPLVDVILLLLIFFLVTSDLLPLKSLPISLTQLSKPTTPQNTSLYLVVDKYQTLYFGSDKRITPLPKLADEVKKNMQEFHTLHPEHTPSLSLTLDASVPYGFFLELIATLEPLNLPIRLVYDEVS